jgi:hypothetical protein
MGPLGHSVLWQRRATEEGVPVAQIVAAATKLALAASTTVSGTAAMLVAI